MGKSRRIKVSKPSKNIPLEEQISQHNSVKPSNRFKDKTKKDEDEMFVDDKLSKRILDQARKQQDDLEEEYGFTEESKEAKPKKTTLIPSTSQDNSDSEEEEFLETEDNCYENVEIDEEDEKALQMFMNKEPTSRKTLADVIKEMLAEKQSEIEVQFSDAGSVKMADLDEKVVEMYKGVKEVLAHYRSGKLPKAFKIIPSLSNWEQILYLTEPDRWTAAAMYQATRIFASNLKEKMAQRFYNLVLLPRVQDDIAEFKRLNVHLYQALQKALFKPAAFYKGIILPLCESGTCTLREAIIIGSILTKNSIPVLHSSAAMIKIAEMEYNGANSIFLRVLLDKKYSLPYRVIDAVVYHFIRCASDKRELPVLWHQCFLTFSQRYKDDISDEQKEALLNVLKVHIHPKITSEIRKELQSSNKFS